jgi:DNA-directed RNA polymerase I subunit RPA1
MTVRGRFFNRVDYQQLVYGALIDFPGEIKIVPPAIWKPVPLWSGKQIITTIVLNLTPKVRPFFEINYCYSAEFRFPGDK